MSKLPHYFIAIPLPDLLKDYFSSWQNDLQQKLSYKEWPHQQDLHITLKFLGPVDSEALLQLQAELKEIEQLEVFSLNVGTIGTFGNPRQPRVVWAGVEKTNQLTILQQRVEECAARIGFAKENREYRPHITLAKKWTGDNGIEGMAEIRKEYREMQNMEVNEVIIYQVFPNRKPRYEVVQTYQLGKECFTPISKNMV
ncbi:MAG TPA: RNA 2',3'-cyclic phosphodiesterase [Bacillus bacterium]|nr:RNA 2',3'-cyclic phosphodiesterase [Bacillus sp. (in: firmicutes)]